MIDIQKSPERLLSPSRSSLTSAHLDGRMKPWEIDTKAWEQKRGDDHWAELATALSLLAAHTKQSSRHASSACPSPSITSPVKALEAAPFDRKESRLGLRTCDVGQSMPSREIASYVSYTCIKYDRCTSNLNKLNSQLRVGTRWCR